MAETMTYDAGTDTVTTSENLTQDEQESLQVGEEMQNQQEQMLAGKFKNAQELENAYIELEKKLGEKSQPSEDSQDPPEAEAKEENSEATFLDTLWEEANSEYKQETLDQLRGMDPTELANMYLDYRKNNNAPPEKATLSDTDVTELKGLVGGPENYDNMLRWAQSNLNETEINMFDQVMDQGNPLAAFFAVRSLAYRYNDAAGYDGRMLSGKPPSAKGDTYRSQAEMVAAMSDPKYDNDPAYRRDVMEKVARSDMKF